LSRFGTNDNTGTSRAAFAHRQLPDHGQARSALGWADELEPHETGRSGAGGRLHLDAIYHTGIGLRLVGWADNSGRTPFDSPGGTFDAAGQDTVLRSHWSNPAANMVADEVQELMLEPGNWGKSFFE
jgi:hypothetical protein